MTRLTRLAIPATCCALLASGCAKDPSALRALDRPIDVERFMGAWYVVSFIPIDFPLFSEAAAHDAVETYRLDEDGRIDITYRFRGGSFDGKARVLRQRGRVLDPDHGGEWRVRVFWPFESAYLIAWLDDQYERAIVGVPSRRYVWVLSRDPVLSEEELGALRDRVAELGYDPTLLRRVPQRETER